MKILIADDDAVGRLFLRATLEKLGHAVLEAEDGEEAWAMCRQEAVHLLILDWMMPKLDGLELCRMIRAEKQPGSSDSYHHLRQLVLFNSENPDRTGKEFAAHLGLKSRD